VQIKVGIYGEGRLKPAMTTLQEKQLAVQEAGGPIRFQIGLPMRYRVSGESVWHDAKADSMSLTEIGFSGAEMPVVGQSIDVWVPLPHHKGSLGATIVSKGKVTASQQAVESPERWFMTASLSKPRLLRFSPQRNQG
jgi:hypothetical protein